MHNTFLVSLLIYLSGGLPSIGIHLEHDVFAALIVLPVFAALFLFIRRARHRVEGQ